MDLEIEVIKNVNNKKYAPNALQLKKKLRKITMIFDVENLL